MRRNMRVEMRKALKPAVEERPDNVVELPNWRKEAS
jgi:hypothetical protein